MVETVLSYGAEIWAPELLCKEDPCSNPCEKEQLAFLRQLYGVRKGTANVVVLAEAGRWPLALRWVKRIAKFYNHLAEEPAESLLGRALRVSAALAEESAGVPLSRRSWVAQVKTAFQRWNINLDTEPFWNIVCRYSMRIMENVVFR